MELRTIIDSGAFEGLLSDTSGRMKNLEPAMKLVGQHLLESIDDTFDREGRGDASLGWMHGWLPLAESTLKQKEKKKGESWKILEGESKRLREGIHVEGTGRDYVDIAPDDLDYARIQQLGGKAGRNKSTTIPARPYLVVQEKDGDRIEEIISDYIMGAI